MNKLTGIRKTYKGWRIQVKYKRSCLKHWHTLKQVHGIKDDKVTLTYLYNGRDRRETMTKLIDVSKLYDFIEDKRAREVTLPPLSKTRLLTPHEVAQQAGLSIEAVNNLGDKALYCKGLLRVGFRRGIWLYCWIGG